MTTAVAVTDAATDGGDVIAMFPPAHGAMTPAQALHSVHAFNPTAVLIIGYAEDGELMIRSSHMSRRDALWLCELAKKNAMGD